MSEQTSPERFPALSALYPSLGLVVRAGDLTLRPLSDEDLPEYAALIRRPIIEDPTSPQVFPWYRASRRRACAKRCASSGRCAAGSLPRAGPSPSACGREAG